MCSITAINRGTGCDNGGVVALYWGLKSNILAATYDDFTHATGVLTALSMSGGTTMFQIDGGIREMMADTKINADDRTYTQLITVPILGWNNATINGLDKAIDCCDVFVAAVFEGGEKYLYGLDYNSTATDFIKPLENFKFTKMDVLSGNRAGKKRADVELTAITQRPFISYTGSIPL